MISLRLKLIRGTAECLTEAIMDIIAIREAALLEDPWLKETILTACVRIFETHQTLEGLRLRQDLDLNIKN